jgi:hypothetical protein
LTQNIEPAQFVVRKCKSIYPAKVLDGMYIVTVLKVYIVANMTVKTIMAKVNATKEDKIMRRDFQDSIKP